MTDATETQFELWIASTRDRFDYHEGPFPDQQTAVAAADEHAMTTLEWSQEPKGQAVTADTHGWMYRVYPVREGREIADAGKEIAVADDATEALTIDAFIEARLQEDELIAQSAIDPERPGTRWCWEDGERDSLQSGVEVEGLDTQAISLRTVEEYPTLAHPLPAFILRQVEARQQGGLWHIARHDPARVLRECAAKRDILAMAQWAQKIADVNDDVDIEHPERTHDSGYRLGQRHAYKAVLRALAAPYADHPDYRSEWSA